MQENLNILISSSNESTSDSKSDFPAIMNTPGSSRIFIKRIKFRTLHSQQHHGEKKIKISNINEEEAADVEIASIDKLIDDCLEQIFMYLSPEERLKNELVCKKWRLINRLLLKRIKKLDYTYVEPDWDHVLKTTGGLFFCYESLLEFKQRFNYVPRLLQLTGKYLRELDISALTNSVILTKLKEISFPHLIKLKLRLYMWNYNRNEYSIRKDWKAKHCDNLFDKMTKLEILHLTIDYRQCIPLNFIIAMLPLANTLKQLSVINFTYHRYTEENKIADGFWSKETSDYYLPRLIEFKSLSFLELKGFYLDKYKYKYTYCL